MKPADSSKSLLLSPMPKSASGNSRVIRSKSSFSFHGMNESFGLPVLETFESLGIISVLNAGNFGSNKNLKKKAQSVNLEKFLKDLEAYGFSGIWNHPMTRCYFLMYLLYKDAANLFVSVYAFRFTSFL